MSHLQQIEEVEGNAWPHRVPYFTTLTRRHRRSSHEHGRLPPNAAHIQH